MSISVNLIHTMDAQMLNKLNQKTNVQTCISLAAQGETKVAVAQLPDPQNWAATCRSINALPVRDRLENIHLHFSKSFCKNSKLSQGIE